jgi:regulator of cell morphogenesis and NO signaling
MQKEEMVLFPMIRQLDRSERLPRFHCGSLANPIRQMELEHSDADSALIRMRGLSDDYTLPPSACDACRSLRESLLVLERDMQTHIDKENCVLFPRAIQLEATKVKAMAEGVFA